MGCKIKWDDDRVLGAMTAILLISRDRMLRGKTVDLIQASLSEYREDPEGYKRNKAVWPEAREIGALVKPQHVAQYKKMIAVTDALLKKMAQTKRQFNSRVELDNALVAYLKDLG